MTGAKEKKSKLWFYIFLLAWVLQMMAAVYFCCQKRGFHEDEYYSYYSTSRTHGLFVEDNTWAEHDDYYQEFVVLENQGFQYALVKQVQSWDVHPPVYYWILHTICSLFPGQFSKWFGLIINLAAFGISMFLLYILALQVTKRDEKLSFLICFFYGFTPAVMSSVVFIRMYALLTVFVLLCAVLHLYAIERGGRLSFGKFLLPAAVITYLGFLTHYYYFIFLFFMAAAFCMYLLWRDKNLWNCIRYGCSVAVSMILAYLTYPSCLGQMFRGQRGAQAANNFFDISNTYMRLQFFWELLDEYVFGKTISVFLLLIVLMLLYIVRKESGSGNSRKSVMSAEKNVSYRILLFTAIGYFLAVSKTALLLGNTSIRYQTPVYGIVTLLIFTALRDLWRRCRENGRMKYQEDAAKMARRQNIGMAVIVMLCIGINLTGVFSDRVVFLYPENEERVAFAKEIAAHKTPALYIYDEGQSWCVWDCADEFFEYDRLYFESQSHTEPITDTVIASSSDLVAYISNAADTEEQLQRIMNSNPNLKEYELQYQEKYCNVYYFR